MTKRKLKSPKFQNTKMKNLQSSQEERHIPRFLTCETSHKKIKDPKMTRRKLKTPKLQNNKTKDLQS
jgi:hypothetical protein